MLVFLDFWWPIGLLLATGLSWLYIGHGIGGADSWRWLFLTASFPAFLTFVVRRTLPESPYYLARTGRTDEAARVLTEITGRPVAPGDIEVADRTRSSIRELFTRALARTDAMMIGVWVALNISYYGFFLWLPFTLSGAKYFQNHIYLLLTLSALSQFPGYAAAIWLVERIGRKPTLAAFLLLGGLSGYAFAAADSSSMYVISLFFVGFFNLGAWGIGLLEGVGKGAAIAGPYIFGNLSDATGGTFWPLTFVALVMAGGGIVAALLGRETRGRKLL
ncbi:MAG: MFS transporter, partial [Actinobacteria bacterium]